MLGNKISVVTGAGGGIGRATAIEMARQGAKVVVSDLEEEGGKETVATIIEQGGDAIFVQCDLRNRESIRQLMERAAVQYGGIDVLHNNAGIHEANLTSQTSVAEMPEEVWDMVFDVNVKAVWLCAKYSIPYLRKSRSAAIINAGSTGSVVAYPSAPSYSASKGAVMQLTKAMAIDLAPDGIRCNCYGPGAVDTRMVSKYIDFAEDKDAVRRLLTGSHLIPRLGRPEEIAKLVCFLASDDASFINGAFYLIDGGTLAWRGTNA
ncbi:glucose 1-dehydrogenase [Aromatoleum toluclasticum]|uniref:SDR family NAD(P)-dependent oxidoreductase n=1 Tax=Aromatoleum toluclasticum TaxID=92003 RepID=UPI001D187F64|nr:glucose 1-dehydrogenase [Aromatoleum toluclasticum]MCC4114737.1 glucose 1-dehydrogenase [Aromatoleum toluclasticum]